MTSRITNKISVRKGLVLSASAIAVATVSALVVSPLAFALPSPVDRGLTSNFAVLAGSGITNTGATTVSGTAGGDMGSAPTTSFTGEVLVTTTGTKYTAASTTVDNAKTALVTVYNDVAGRTPVTATISADLGGSTLTKGVYNSASSLGLTGTLTLDGENDPDAVFIFQAGSTLTTASTSDVELINGAQACNVFWQVGSSATFGTNSDFVGHVLALTSITATTGAVFNGSLQARNGAVTLDTNTIINDECDEEGGETPGGGTTLPSTGVPAELTIIGGGVAAAALVAGVTVAVRRRRSV